MRDVITTFRGRGFEINLYAETYIRDIKERYQIKNVEDMDNLLDFISSAIGSLTNPTKLANTFETTVCLSNA